MKSLVPLGPDASRISFKIQHFYYFLVLVILRYPPFQYYHFLPSLLIFTFSMYLFTFFFFDVHNFPLLYLSFLSKHYLLYFSLCSPSNLGLISEVIFFAFFSNSLSSVVSFLSFSNSVLPHIFLMFCSLTKKSRVFGLFCRHIFLACFHCL